MDGSSPLLRGVRLHHAFGSTPVLTDVSLEARAGRITGILGPNGAGKSTLLRLLLGVLTPSAGELFLGTTPYAAFRSEEGRRAFARRVALVPQEVSVSFPFRVREVVELGRLPHLPPPGFLPTPARLGLGRQDDERATARALATCDLTELADRPLASLSGGERRRVFLARALAQDAEILLLDEPTGALDVGQQLALQVTLRRLTAEGRAVVAVGHDLSWMDDLCDEVLLLRDGRSVAAGPPAEVLTPRHLEATFGLPFEVASVEAQGRRRRRVFFPTPPASSPAAGDTRSSAGKDGESRA